MRILSIRPVAGGKTLAVFDVELSDHLRMYSLLLRKTESGAFRTVAPKANGKHAASFHPALAEQISTAAVAALGGRVADDRT